MTAVLIGGVAALVAIRLALRRAPLTTMLGIGVLGLALHGGVIRLPAAIVAPVTRAHLALQGWQRRQAGDLACQVAATSTLLGTGGSAADRVARGCGLAASAARTAAALPVSP